MPRSKGGLTCADCGQDMWKTDSSLPQGKARCHPCRQASPGRTSPAEYVCDGCGSTFSGKRRSERRFCTIQCANLFHNVQRRVRDASDGRVRRFQREQAAPGLTRRERDRLLLRWKRQGRTCFYCPSAATTIDHVLPLVRGGTNFEGNLAPCCRPCNSSKAGWMLIEWRTGRRISPMAVALPWTKRAKKVRPLVVVQKELRICPVCTSLHDRPIYCSSRCCSTANERRKTERNRKPPRTECPNGHPYTEENRRVRTRIRDGIARIETECRPCNRDAERRKELRRRSAA